MLKIFFIPIIATLQLTVSAQKTSEQLGEYLFNYFKKDSINKIDNLIPTLEEMKVLAEKIGINKDSKQYSDVINGYDSELDKFHESISVFIQTL